MNSDASLVVQIILVCAIIASIIITSRYTKQSNDEHKKSNDTYRTISDIGMIFTLDARIYQSDHGGRIIEMAKDPAEIIVDPGKQEGVIPELPHRKVENFLNDVETAFLLKEQKILTDDIFKRTFSWVIDRITENKSIMDFIKAKQQEYGAVAWKPISDYYHQKQLDSKNGH